MSTNAPRWPSERVTEGHGFAGWEPARPLSDADRELIDVVLRRERIDFAPYDDGEAHG